MIIKKHLSMDVLIVKGPMKVIKYPNLFTHLESNFTKELIKGGKNYMTYDVLKMIINKMHMLIKHI